MKFMYKNSKYDFTYCTISTVSTRILKICWPRWPINFLLSSSDFLKRLFFWPLRVTELAVEMVQYWWFLTNRHKADMDGPSLVLWGIQGTIFEGWSWIFSLSRPAVEK